jgi:hypothetical protein
MAGRPTIYCERIKNAICLLLKHGCTRTAAAGKAGIHYDTFHEWMDSNSEFSEAVMRAEGEAEAFFTETIRLAAQGMEDKPPDWRAAESWLKRRRRTEWGENIAVRADTEAQRLLAELFPADAAEDPSQTGGGEGETTSL